VSNNDETFEPLQIVEQLILVPDLSIEDSQQIVQDVEQSL
jgi:hypothetical protein